jgi:uncharacterized protein (TIGR01777 family)
MKVVIAGGTGFLGRPLVESLAAEGSSVVVLSRGGPRRLDSGRVRTVAWTPDGDVGDWAGELDGADAVINLAGESIAARRWTETQKHRILDSRLLTTRSLVRATSCAKVPPKVFISGSAVGYYGPARDDLLSEDAPPGGDFLARVCVEWEAEARHASSDLTRVVIIRTGLVLERDGGALPRMLPPFKLGAGGRVGSGRQYWPWIHREDWIAMIRWVIARPGMAGAVNATGPTPVTNAEFARTLGEVLHRPALMPVPGFVLEILLGEMAGALLLSGQRAIPARAERAGFTFRYARLLDALRAIFNRR